MNSSETGGEPDTALEEISTKRQENPMSIAKQFPKDKAFRISRPASWMHQRDTEKGKEQLGAGKKLPTQVGDDS